MKTYKIGVLSGSLRKDSFSTKVAKHLIANAPEGLTLELMDLSNLGVFNDDFEANEPKAWKEFRDKVTELDGFIFVTPEYNRSFPALLKNALDIASRPSTNRWNGKPAAVIGVSPGALAAAMSVNQIKQPMTFLNLVLMNSPEQYIGHAGDLFDENGTMTQEYRINALKDYMDKFQSWVEKIVG
ncbi:MAG: NAD(P)H-dependent oxidoreductase [Lachnospiraceae bacterium]|jgi:chromate reductase|nr:NAD(P)H-dependent oxidoreductase [Lachnospiraceae bacterium]